MAGAKKDSVIGKIIIYLILFVVAFTMLVPFAWMLSASVKLNKDVFTFPMLCHHLAKDPAGNVHVQHLQAYDHCNAAAAVYLQLCRICVCKAAF